MIIYSIHSTNKGYIIKTKENNVCNKYFLRDEEHLSKKQIPEMIALKQFITIGAPFGDNIIPIFSLMPNQPQPIVYKPVVTKPTKIYDYRLIIIWRYYRALVLKNNKPKFIKQCANKMKAQLKLRGIENTYLWVLNAQERESNNIFIIYKQYFNFTNQINTNLTDHE